MDDLTREQVQEELRKAGIHTDRAMEKVRVALDSDSIPPVSTPASPTAQPSRGLLIVSLLVVLAAAFVGVFALASHNAITGAIAALFLVFGVVVEIREVNRLQKLRTHRRN